MAHSRFASLDENDLSKLLADKDSGSTKKAAKLCEILVKLKILKEMFVFTLLQYCCNILETLINFV